MVTAMVRWLAVLVFAVGCGTAAAQDATNQDDGRGADHADGVVGWDDGVRVALVIGNGAYRAIGPLANPTNDAAAVADALRETGFQVVQATDVDYEGMRQALREFNALLTPGATALFYYAGHGIQYQGINYLLPVGAELTREADLIFEGFDANTVLSLMADAGSRLNIVILDACRNNPFVTGSRNVQRGLAEMSVAGAETVIAYATAPGQVAADGVGAHSPYTAALLQHLGEPGLEIGRLFREVRRTVRESTGDQQIPWVSSTLEGEFYFNPPDPDDGVAEMSDEERLWRAIADSTDPADFETYLASYPEGLYAQLAENRLAALADAEPRVLAVLADTGPVPVEFLLPASREGEAAEVRIDAVPQGGRLSLDDATLWPGETIDLEGFGRLAFTPDPGFSGDAGQMAFSVIGPEGVRMNGQLSFQVVSDPCDAFSGVANYRAALLWVESDFAYQWPEFDATQALDACSAAVEAYPEVARFQFTLGRARFELASATGDYGNAVDTLEQAVEIGSGAAAYQLGEMYRYGVGAAIDAEAAITWFERAIALGERRAASSLGNILLNNPLVADPTRGLAMIEEAAEDGEPYAQLAMFRLFDLGEHGFPQDPGQAMRWFIKAASHGDASPPGLWHDTDWIPEEHWAAAVQLLLNERGYDAGPADGQPGPRTLDAIRAFQADIGLPPSGEIDYFLMTALGRDRPLPGDTIQDCDDCPVVRVLPAGQFMMGPNPVPGPDEPSIFTDAVPVHQVTFTAPFAIGTHEVTFAEYDACVADGACVHVPDDHGWGRGDRPVIDVNWHDAMAYVHWLSVTTGRDYRLPSEAEWEYAARAGLVDGTYWADGGDPCGYLNGDDAAAAAETGEAVADTAFSCDDGYPYTAPVGSFTANAYGLYDMLGNVWEWLADCQQYTYIGAPIDGSAWQDGDCDLRAQRGPSFDFGPVIMNLAYRAGAEADSRRWDVGFRVALTLE